MYLDAGRECRYAEARRGYRWHKGTPRGAGAVRGVLANWQGL